MVTQTNLAACNRKERAVQAGLFYVNSYEQWIVRRRCGRGFTYVDHQGVTIRCPEIRDRIHLLAIPPAWKPTLICPSALGHIQAIGNDVDGRRQAIYHSDWEAISRATKFHRMSWFGNVLPRIRRRVRRDLSLVGLPAARTLAAVVRLIDKAHLRVGNTRYSKANGTAGVTTLRKEHIDVHDSSVELNFTGKSGQQRHVELADSKIAEVIHHCEEIAGQFLFQYLEDDETTKRLTSTDVNDYLRDISGEDISAKDFRTWWGCSIALREFESLALQTEGPPKTRSITAAIDRVASELGNTRAVCRSSYIHPGLQEVTKTGHLWHMLKPLPEKSKPELTLAETRFAALVPSLKLF